MSTSRKPHTLLSISLLATWLAGGALTGAGPALAAPAIAQAAPAAGQTGAARLIGTITASAPDSLSVKLETGGAATISITPQTRIVRTAPGEKTLAGATPIHLEDLATGDRVLVRATPGADPTHYSALVVVTMKQADIAQVHATQSEDWQRRGVGGIVKSIDAAPPTDAVAAPGAVGGASTGPGATIVVGTAQPGRTLSIHVTPATTIRRYAADSVNFADAKPATLGEIHPGDQLRARGDHSPDGTDVLAVEIVAGSFRNVAGTITSIDAAQKTVTVTDLATKKPVTLKLTAETQMRKLPTEMAQRLAARTGQAPAGGPPGANRPGAPGAPVGTAPGGGMGVPGTPPTAEAASGPGQPRGRGDAATMLQHAPSVTLAELNKGDAIMVVASRGGGSAGDAATAITLIAGVEPLLESSSSGAGQNLFSASWNLNGGDAAAAQ